MCYWTERFNSSFFTCVITDQIGFRAVHLPLLKKGKLDCNKNKKKINPASLNNPVAYNLIAVMKNAHKNAKQNKKQKLETKPSRLATIKKNVVSLL